MAIDWSNIYQKYKGLWVAFADDEKTVVGSGNTPKKALKQAQEKGIKNPILYRMPDTLIVYVGFSL